MDLSQFKYFGKQVKFKAVKGDDGYYLKIYILGKLASKIRFNDKVGVLCAKFKHLIARELGAKFNSQGNWCWDTIPRENRQRATEIFKLKNYQ